MYWIIVRNCHEYYEFINWDEDKKTAWKMATAYTKQSQKDGDIFVSYEVLSEIEVRDLMKDNLVKDLPENLRSDIIHEEAMNNIHNHKYPF